METACPMRSKVPETGDLGYGALVVKNGMIIGWAPSSVIVNRDPTAHAEIEAIRDASGGLGRRTCPGASWYPRRDRVLCAKVAVTTPALSVSIPPIRSMTSPTPVRRR